MEEVLPPNDPILPEVGMSSSNLCDVIVNSDFFNINEDLDIGSELELALPAPATNAVPVDDLSDNQAYHSPPLSPWSDYGQLDAHVDAAELHGDAAATDGASAPVGSSTATDGALNGTMLSLSRKHKYPRLRLTSYFHR